MDFIEDHIIHNGFIDDDLKMNLLNSDPLVTYAFIGAFLHISGSSDTECDEEQSEIQDIAIDEVE